jgi:hypothetical protein
VYARMDRRAANAVSTLTPPVLFGLGNEIVAGSIGRPLGTKSVAREMRIKNRLLMFHTLQANGITDYGNLCGTGVTRTHHIRITSNMRRMVIARACNGSKWLVFLLIRGPPVTQGLSGLPQSDRHSAVP